ncbi:uncharacterized protein LOC110852301 [Folsomia candida]|uniref:Uncharacterized protein n=1 Tax=Folsomia candida TaxID=158441 RepID=A0A226E3N2_FOLCA|nr:uncharacterized protein LOC110852301 [Folsomia candida]OXA51577.1 hypothetical protein Fcan01_12956 [Folsomia candida]
MNGGNKKTDKPSDKGKEKEKPKPRPGSWEEWKAGWGKFTMSKKDYNEWLTGKKNQDKLDEDEAKKSADDETDKPVEKQYCLTCGTGVLKNNGLQCRNPYCVAKTLNF